MLILTKDKCKNCATRQLLRITRVALFEVNYIAIQMNGQGYGYIYYRKNVETIRERKEARILLVIYVT